MKRILVLLMIFSLNGGIWAGTNSDVTSWVDPFIGTTIKGRTFPGPTAPFGMVQVNPTTITQGGNCSGYNYLHHTLEGFAFTQMSGVGWYGDLGNFLVMPATGPLYTNSGKEEGMRGYRSVIDKKTEEASIGYYKVFLSDYDIQAEATATAHCGMLRFTYPQNKVSRIQIDLARRVGGTSVYQKVKIIDDYTISGQMLCNAQGGGWGNGQGKPDYTVHFYAKFSKPLRNYGIWSANVPEGQNRKREFVESKDFQLMASQAVVLRNVQEYEGKHIGFFTEFETKENEEVLFKAGISFVSEEGARKNLETEMRDWDFSSYCKQTKSLWNNALSKVQISGGTEDQRTMFYTALYHSMLDPRIFTDVDGNYIGGDKKQHEAKNFVKRTIFSGWDVFRSQIPLLTVLAPSVVNDLLHSLVSLAEENGTKYYDRWEFLNAYSGCMVGNPTIYILLDAYVKGITDIDINKAYEYGVNTCNKFGNGALGYVSSDKRLCVSETLEYAYGEWCMSQLAKLLNKKKEYTYYKKLSQSYRNIYDKNKHSFRPLSKDGVFKEWPADGSLNKNYGCVESNELQQRWFVPHDIQGMVEIMGGRERVLADLDTLFSKTPRTFEWNDYYNHANEPVHHIPFLFNRLGQPWETQKWVRFICENAYKNDVDGLPGSDDVGQMSAWYVLAAMGFHPLCLGESTFEICSPIFDEIKINVGKNRTFVIKTHNNSLQNKYIQSMTLNGKKYKNYQIHYQDIMNGGVLEFQMGPNPDE